MMAQIVPLIVFAVIGYFAFTRMKAMKGAATSSTIAERKRLAGEFAATRQQGESDATFVGLGTFNKLSRNRAFFVALTNKRLLVGEVGTPGLRAYDRNAIAVTAKRAKWTNIGNTQMTTTSGYDVDLTLSDEALALRLYDESPYDAGHASAMAAFLHEVGVA